MTSGREVKLSCRNLWKVYGERPGYYFDAQGYKIEPRTLADRMRNENHIPACADVSFDVHVGEIFVIMGLSGSGKSTVVRCLSRLVEPSHGEVLLDGRDLLALNDRELIEVRRHKVGMVFQSFGLMPHLNVIDNVAFPLKLQGLKPAERRERALRVIELVGLKGREQHFPRQLSGGQQQRVGIARSLAVEPELWLLDEPFSALDPLIRRQMQDEFLRIQQMLRKSIVFITHDFLEALRIADRMAIMRDGLIVQMGTPAELIMSPADDYVAEFTRDVPMVRVLRAKDVARAGGGDTATLDRVPESMTIEELLPKLAGQSRGLAVTDTSGAVIGVATAGTVVEALGREVRGKDSGQPQKSASHARA